MSDSTHQNESTDEQGVPPEDGLLMKLYSEVGVALDALPYTEQFDRLYSMFAERYPEWSKADVFRRLTNLRKQGVLPRLVRPRDAG